MLKFSLKSALLPILFIVLTTSAFAESNTDGDDRMKIRLGFTSVNDLHRQLLVTEDSNSTAGIDFGYDAESFDNHIDDMYWMIDDRKFTIQGIDVINADTVLPLGLHTGNDGVNTILIDELINVPAELEIVIYDTETNTYHNIKDNSGFTIDLPAGSYLTRFELRFADHSEETSSEDETTEEEEEEEVIAETEVEIIAEEIETTESNEIKIRFVNNTRSITINKNDAQTIKSVEVYNFSGQLKEQFNNFNAKSSILKVDDKSTAIKTNNLETGHYIIVVNTNLGTTSKKILVN